jgi:tetratricopeptide (TPR) repeat protein
VNYPLNQNRWSPIADYALLLGSGAGAVASIATQNATIATLPITALVAMGLLNRRRIDRYLQHTDDALANLEGQFASDISILTEQISALPKPEAINQLQRSAIEHSDRQFVQFSEALEKAQQGIDERLGAINYPNLSQVHQDVTELQDQYTYACTSLNNLSKQVEWVAQQNRLEDTETDISAIRTDVMQLRVSLESLSTETKTAQATLQDTVRHLDRRLRQLPHSDDPSLLKGEVRELIKAVSDLVPRRDFAALVEKMQTLQESQETLRKTVGRLQSASSLSLEGSEEPSRVVMQSAQLEALQTELMTLTTHLQQIESQLEDIAAPFDITAEIRSTTATYLSGLQWQLAALEAQAQTLSQQQQSLNVLPSGRLPSNVLPADVVGLSRPSAQDSMQWLMALRSHEAHDDQWSTVDQALCRALDEVSQRLILVWPWSSAIALDDRFVGRFYELLESGCRLDIGWCHPGNRHEGRLLKAITQQWRLTTAQRHVLKSTLRQLLPLKKRYPHLFSFKILGTHEQFLVCDRRYAIVGMETLPVASSAFSHLDMRVKTTDTRVVSQLVQRFEHPDALPEDAMAYFNRAITRYDLRDPDGAIADFAQVLRLNPNDVIALNNRGLIWVEKKQYQRAFDDFDHALSSDPTQFAARCNRGWLWMNQGQLEPAIADFDQAIQAEPNSPIPHFYRGTARQQSSDSLGAIADFTRAIHKQPQAALPYCYRGAAYQRQGDIIRAISDLETAASLMHAQGEHRSLAQVTQALASLKQVDVAQPLKLRTA